MTGKDLRCKPWVVEKAKLEYSVLGKASSKGFAKEDKKEELLKRLENIEGMKEQSRNELREIKNGLNKANENAFKTPNFISKLDPDSKEMFYKIKEIDKAIDYTKRAYVHTDAKIYDFNIFRRLGDFIRSIHYADILLEQTFR